MRMALLDDSPHLDVEGGGASGLHLGREQLSACSAETARPESHTFRSGELFSRTGCRFAGAWSAVEAVHLKGLASPVAQVVGSGRCFRATQRAVGKEVGGAKHLSVQRIGRKVVGHPSVNEPSIVWSEESQFAQPPNSGESPLRDVPTAFLQRGPTKPRYAWMGQEVSGAGQARVEGLRGGSRIYDSDVLYQYACINGHDSRRLSVDTSHCSEGSAPFRAALDVCLPTTLVCAARHGHITASLGDRVYFGLGFGMGDRMLDDIWFLDQATMTFHMVGSGYPMLKYARAVIAMGRFTAGVWSRGCDQGAMHATLFVFGGAKTAQDGVGDVCVNDLWAMDIDGGCEQVSCFGELPHPMMSPVFELGGSGDSLVLWGGFDGCKRYGDIHVFDIATQTWRRVPTAEPGRAGVGFCRMGDSILCHGGSSTDGLIDICMSELRIKFKIVHGHGPDAGLFGGQMVVARDFVFCLGGKSRQREVSGVFALDVDNLIWHPVQVTGQVRQGRDVDGDGYVQLETRGASCFFEPRRRAIVYLLGNPRREPVVVSQLLIGETLACLHQWRDMRLMLSMGS